jgi:hypothetical protein
VGIVETDEEISNALRVSKILSGSFLVASFVYVGIFFFALQQGIAPVMNDESLIDIIMAMLAAIGILCLVGGYYLPKYLIKQGKKKQVGQLDNSIRGNLLTANIIGFAFFESIAIFGLILGLLSARWELVLSFAGVSIIAMLLAFPTRDRWGKAMRED